MRGDDTPTGELFSYVDREARVRALPKHRNFVLTAGRGGFSAVRSATRRARLRLPEKAYWDGRAHHRHARAEATVMLALLSAHAGSVRLPSRRQRFIL
jgi:hypothetical protein